MGILLNRVRKNMACVYLLKIKNRYNLCYKVGYTKDLDVRLQYYPDSLDITVLDTLWGEKEDIKAFEKFIHLYNKDKYLWVNRRFSGYSETYNKSVDIKQWYKWFKAGLPEEQGKTDNLENYINY